jgi:hypothetical protein
MKNTKKKSHEQKRIYDKLVETTDFGTISYAPPIAQSLQRSEASIMYITYIYICVCRNGENEISS